MATDYTSLVDMQQRACAQFAQRNLFGTKKSGAYFWTTYKEFGDDVDAFRAALASLDVKRGERVAIIANNRVEWAVSAYASYGLGANFVPMYEAQLPKDWEYILGDSAATVLLVSTEEIYERVKDFPERLENLRHVICFEAPATEEHSYQRYLDAHRDSNVEAIEPESGETAGLIYTSGTTGEPKGVILSHGNFVSNVNAVQTLFPIQEDDSSLSFLPWAHSFGQTCELHTMMSRGASIGLAESVQTLIDNFSEVRPTILFSVPRIFNRIYDGLQKRMAEEKPLVRFLFNMGVETARKRRELAERGEQSFWVEKKYALLDRLVFAKVRGRFGGRLKYAFSGGAALSREVGLFIDDIGIQVYEGYGLTETSPIATANNPQARKIGTIGKPIPGVTIEICDEDGNVLPRGTEGEIVVIGPNVMQGYNNRPEDTAEVIFDLNGQRAFRTGDMGSIGTDGFVRITGRFKEQYKLENGKYVVPSPLEEKLKLSGYVNQIYIDGDGRPFNIALVVPDFEALEKWGKNNGVTDLTPEGLVKNQAAHALIGEELKRYSDDFKGYERPLRWKLITDEFSVANDMMTPSLKIKRRNVQKTYAADIEELYASA